MRKTWTSSGIYTLETGKSIVPTGSIGTSPLTLNSFFKPESFGFTILFAPKKLMVYQMRLRDSGIGCPGSINFKDQTSLDATICILQLTATIMLALAKKVINYGRISIQDTNASHKSNNSTNQNIYMQLPVHHPMLLAKGNLRTWTWTFQISFANVTLSKLIQQKTHENCCSKLDAANDVYAPSSKPKNPHKSTQQMQPSGANNKSREYCKD